MFCVLVPEYSMISYLCNGFDFNQWTVLVVNKLSVHLGMNFDLQSQKTGNLMV